MSSRATWREGLNNKTLFQKDKEVSSSHKTRSPSPAHSASQSVYAPPVRQCLVSIEVAPWPWVGLQESGQSCHLKWWEYYKHNLVERELWKEKETRRNSFVLLLEEREVECALMPLLYASPVAPHLTCSRFQLCLVLSMWRTWDIEIIMQTYLCSWSWEAYRSGPFPWALGLFPNALLHPWEATQSQLFSFPPYCIALLLKAQRLKADYPGAFSSGSL